MLAPGPARGPEASLNRPATGGGRVPPGSSAHSGSLEALPARGKGKATTRRCGRPGSCLGDQGSKAPINGPVGLVTSRRNPLVARFRRAARHGARVDSNVLLEGPRLVEEALAASLRVNVAAVSTTPAPRISALARRLEPVARVVRVTAAVMDVLSPASTPSGLVALAALRPAPVEEAMRASPPLVVGLSGVQDPGNTGAAIRAVEAGGASGVVTVGGADPLGWKALRGAMGSAFRLPIACAGDPASVARVASTHGLRVIAAAPRGGTPLAEIDLTGPCLVWLGAEGPGLDRGAAATADETVSIPMRPPVESLNIAVAAALIVYEAARQRDGGVPSPAPGAARPAPRPA